MKIEKILIVADNSLASVKAIQYGFNLARDVGAKVLLLSVIEPESAAGNPDAGIFPDDALMNFKNQTTNFQEEIKTTYAHGVDTETLAPVGEILPVVVQAITDWGANLVVAGTHNRSGISKLFSGSVSESIIHQSSVPVLIVPGA